MPERTWGPSTRAIHAGLPPAQQGEPLLAGPVLAAPYHLSGEIDAAPYGYTRDGNPTWTALEAALGALEGGETVCFASGMAALTAVVLGRLRPGDRLVAPGDGYPGIRKLASERLQPAGIRVDLVPTDTEQIVTAARGAALVWVETPANPRLDVCDLEAVAAAVRAEGALLGVDNTVATPLGQRPLDFGAHFSMCAGTKSLAGHSDLLLGSVAVRDGALAADLRAWRSQTGAIPSPFEAWLAHRSLATLELRLARQSQNALALAGRLADRDGVADVRHPSQHEIAFRQMGHFGPLVGFTLASAAAAQAFLSRAELVVEATSFGGVHTTAERRARWGTDAVAEGFVRLSAGCEDTADLIADVEQALDG
ncbi:MAG: cystathionine gamma-lyase [Actinomycetota bacterium]|nr:cystathionine gamma-lyase [Actinomycetota bacterium]